MTVPPATGYPVNIDTAIIDHEGEHLVAEIELNSTNERVNEEIRTMKAVVYTAYGPPEVLHVREVEKPTPQDSEVLIKVHATTVTTGDVNMRGFTFVPAGLGFAPRLMFGLTGPRKPILGVEVAGEVVAMGRDVSRFQIGDRVFGIDSGTLGAYAEYVCRPANGGLVKIPAGMSYEDAAAVSFGAGTTVYFLKDKANIQPGQKVLINGASGCVGSFAVQIAKHYGAKVTGVCSTRNLELVRSLGADQVIDYTREDFTKGQTQYDVIFDTVSKSSFAGCREVLAPKGLYIAGAGGLKEGLQSAWTALRGDQKVIFGSPREGRAELLEIKKLIEQGAIKPYIDRRYSLEETVEAHRYVDTGRKRGNVVIIVDTDSR